jgi:phosphonate transport system permease protein
MWALLFISAVGTSPLAAVLALAIPYGGTLAKVFSELLDEASASAGEVMRMTGGRGFAAFWGGVVPQALPDLVTYTLYRFECSVRSSAVLGFVGIPTLGYQISAAFEDGHFREIWSYLYALLFVVILIEWWGSRVRALLAKGRPVRSAPLVGDAPAILKRKRGRSIFLRLTGILAIVFAVISWSVRAEWLSGVSASRRWENLQRFAGELVPYPVRGDGGWREVGPWLQELLVWEGLQALWRTLHLGTAGALLAGMLALMGIFLAARSLANRQPRGVPMLDGLWHTVVGYFFRIGAVVARSLPEFILAFLLLQMLGPTIWALILALAIHNAGILLRLGAEVVDNAKNPGAELMLAQGGGRLAVFLGVLVPENFNRFVLYLFYRWETCIREATMLGMLGVGSLGFLISEAEVRFYYDEMLLWVILGGSLVFIGDLLSDWVRLRLKSL